MIEFDFATYTNQFINPDEFNRYNSQLIDVKQLFDPSRDMTGWYDLATLFTKDLITDIINTANYIKNNCDVFLIIGIGGSYLGSRAIIEALKPYFSDNQPNIYYLGTSLSSDYYHDLINRIKDKQIIVNVISKSGSTLETNIAYSLIMDLMHQKYSNEELKNRIIITTDKEKGKLRQDVNQYSYKSFIIPNNIGGRYSVFTPAGLLPLAVANIDLNKLYLGAQKANADLTNQIRYAIIRKIMFNNGKIVEAYVTYEPKLAFFLEWLKQLYGESLGKENKGILPISFINTTDLHSLGQFIQEGNKILFETVFNIKNSHYNIHIDQYNKTLNELNNIATTAVSKAHQHGGVLNNVINIESLNEETIGYLMQFFMISCVISAHLDNVNPFDQNGVEEYKKIINSLLQGINS